MYCSITDLVRPRLHSRCLVGILRTCFHLINYKNTLYSVTVSIYPFSFLDRLSFVKICLPDYLLKDWPFQRLYLRCLLDHLHVFVAPGVGEVKSSQISLAFQLLALKPKIIWN